jgi:hypothetical protein
MALEINEQADATLTQESKKKSKKHRRQEAGTGGLYVTLSTASLRVNPSLNI